MITSNQILEIFTGSGTSYGRSINIYENPTSSDFLLLSKEAKADNRKLDSIRFIANAKSPQKVYVADADICTHENMRRILKLPLMWSSRTRDYWLIDGLAVKTSSGAKFDRCMLYVENFVYDWSFADRYISGFSNYLANFKRKYIRK